MDWTTVAIPTGQDHFLTGDSPVVVNAGSHPTPILSLSIALSPQKLLVMCEKSTEFDLDFIHLHALSFGILVVKQTKQHLVSSKLLTDSACIKYTKVIQSMLAKDKNV